MVAFEPLARYAPILAFKPTVRERVRRELGKRWVESIEGALATERRP